MKTAFLASAMTVILPLLASADGVFIPGVDDIGASVENTPPNPMTACFLDAASPQCANAELGGGQSQFESAFPGAALEILLFNPDGSVATRNEAPPRVDYAAPIPVSPVPVGQPAHPSEPVKLPSVAVTIEFDFDSDRIGPDQLPKIAMLTEILNDPRMTGTHFAVIGHTDAKGSDAYNCNLSQRRALSIVGLLQAGHVAAALYPLGFGETAPKNVHDPAAAENRRVTFLRLPDQTGPILATAQAVCGL